jgi:hypothetical protein
MSSTRHTLINTSTHQHNVINTSHTYQHINTSTQCHQHVTHQHSYQDVNHRHINTSTHQHINTMSSMHHFFLSVLWCAPQLSNSDVTSAISDCAKAMFAIQTNSTPRKRVNKVLLSFRSPVLYIVQSLLVTSKYICLFMFKFIGYWYFDCEIALESKTHHLLGNLCRCTGYRPILDAAKTFATDSRSPCCRNDQCCRNTIRTTSEDSKENRIEVSMNNSMINGNLVCSRNSQFLASLDSPLPAHSDSRPRSVFTVHNYFLSRWLFLHEKVNVSNITAGKD